MERTPAARAADVVLHGGKVITVDPAFSLQQAVAIAGNRIAFVGSSAAALELADGRTRVIDLAGRAVMPGLIDGHAHMDREGLKRVFPSLAQARSIADVQREIAGLAQRTPRGEWIVTMPLGDPPYYTSVPECYAEQRLPTRHDLDQAAPDHPVYIRPIWGFWRHTTPLVSIANSRALALAGITKETPVPADSVVIDKDPASGEPTGIFYDHTLMSLVEMTLMRAATGFSLADRTRTLPDAMRAYHAFGTTSVFEEHGVAGELLRAYKIVHERGEMSMRATLVLSPNWLVIPNAEFEPVIEAWAGWLAGRGFGDDFLRVSGIFVDVGLAPEDALRSSLGPYTGWAGFNFATGLPRERAKALCLACAKHGIRVVAIWPNMLDVFDEVNREIDITASRWVLGHISALSAGQIAKVRALGLVVTSHTNRYVYKEGHLLKQKCPARENEIAPLRSLVDAGVPVSLATDNVPPSMFYPVWQSVCRRNRYTGETIAPEQALTREQALRAATLAGAYVTCEESIKGSIEAGKLADLAVLSHDPLTVDEDALKDIVAEMTFVDGRLVYERPVPS